MSKPKRPPLTNKRRAWADGRNGVFQGNALNVNKSTALRFQSRLERLIDEMTKEVEREFQALLKKPSAQKVFAQDDVFSTTASRLFAKLRKRFTGWFDDKAEPISESMSLNVDKSSKSTLHSSLSALTGGLSLATGKSSRQTKETLNASVKQSVALIKTIPSQYFDKIEGAVMRSVQSGGANTAEVFKEIQGFGVVTKKRAEFIARDQTSKATTAVNNARMNDLGIRQFKWLHSGGGKEPRKLHLKYDGQIFDLDNPPVVDERSGRRGLPGQEPNCRCRMVPIISYGNTKQ